MCKVKCTGSIKLTSAVYTRGADVRFVPGKFRWTCVCYGLSSGNILTIPCPAEIQLTVCFPGSQGALLPSSNDQVVYFWLSVSVLDVLSVGCRLQDVVVFLDSRNF